MTELVLIGALWKKQKTQALATCGVVKTQRGSINLDICLRPAAELAGEIVYDSIRPEHLEEFVDGNKKKCKMQNVKIYTMSVFFF